MSAPTELWKKWEGRVVDEKFPLRQWLGGSDHSAVFLTERTGKESGRIAVKLIPAENLYPENLYPDNLKQENVEDDAQLSRWAGAAKLSHPHLIRLFECGLCQIDGTRLLYIVMEYAEENLAEILPLRPLAPAEVFEMLRPAAEALAFLHQAGFSHGRIKPSNIMAADNRLKISVDGLRQIGERDETRTPSAYDAPEVATVGLSPAADSWSLGITLVTVLTQDEPRLKNGVQGPIAVPETIPQPFGEIARQCLQVDPQQRCTADDILRQIQPHALQTPAPMGAKVAEAHTPQDRPRRWIVVPIVVAALFLIAWVGHKFMVHQPQVPPAENRPANLQPPSDVPPARSLPPFSEDKKPAQMAVAQGSVLQQVLPDVSRSAQNTIEGRVKVSVQVAVDASGNVSQVKFVSPGPSKYFANLALAAARRWKFNPPQADGQATGSEWVLRFQFGRTSTQVFPAEIKP
jgi:TonB family protein